MKSLLHRLIRLDHLIHLKSTGTPANCANKIDFHRDGESVILGPLKQARSLDFRPMKALSFSLVPGASIRSGNWLWGFVAMVPPPVTPVPR